VTSTGLIQVALVIPETHGTPATKNRPPHTKRRSGRCSKFKLSLAPFQIWRHLAKFESTCNSGELRKSEDWQASGRAGSVALTGGGTSRAAARICFGDAGCRVSSVHVSLASSSRGCTRSHHKTPTLHHQRCYVSSQSPALACTCSTFPVCFICLVCSRSRDFPRGWPLWRPPLLG